MFLHACSAHHGRPLTIKTQLAELLMKAKHPVNHA